MKTFVSALTALSVLAVTGCATITKGSSQVISVSSNVEGAQVFLEGVLVGETPFTGSVKKNKSQLRVELDGYRAETITLSKSLEPIFWGNIIIGGTLGSITDFATGAAYQYAPASYQVDLQRGDQSDEDFMWEVAARKFSMIYVDQIAADLAAGDGEYAAALVEILNSKLGTGDVESDDLKKALEASRGFAPEFGKAVLALR